jgi:hypothetical protein
VILGGCVVFTAFAAVGVWLVSGNATYSLYLALAAHVQLLIGMSAFGWVLGRRPKFKGGRDGFELDDTSHPVAVEVVNKPDDPVPVEPNP